MIYIDMPSVKKALSTRAKKFPEICKCWVCQGVDLKYKKEFIIEHTFFLLKYLLK